MAFTKGDRVKLIRNCDPFKVGETGVVVSASLEDALVRFDNARDRGHGTNSAHWHVENDKLAASLPPTNPLLDVLNAVKDEMKKLPTSTYDRSRAQDGAHEVLTRILAVAGLKYAEKPPVPVKPEYDFLPR